jgi:DNA-binding winged helix-turn-helix (wHTH) protein/Tol biopolymer transport system component
MMAPKSFVFRFADFEVREREFALVKTGETVAVEPKAFRVLLILLRNPGKLIPKQELLDAVWGDAAVTENSLARAVGLLRKLLGDEARAPRFIETVATVGYRFLGNVEVEAIEAPAADAESISSSHGSETPEPAPQPLPEPSKHRFGWKGASAVGAAALVLLASAIWYWPQPPPQITQYVRLTRDGQSGVLAAIDESRIYVNRFSPARVGELSAQGGDLVSMDLPVKNPFVIAGSPDGSSLLVNSWGTPDVWKVGVLDRSIRPIPELRLGWNDTDWSPDGKFIAYSTPDGDVYRVNSDWTDKRTLFSARGDKRGYVPYALSWSPDGAKLRFTMDFQIWEVSSDGAGAHPVLTDPDPSHYICCGRWTADGSFYLYLTGDSLLRSATYVPAGNIWALDERHGLLRRPRTGPVQLTSGPIRWGVPFSSKDSKRIFAQGVVLRGKLERYEAQSHQFQPFLGGISAEFVEFSRDGKSVAYVTYPEGILWKADADGSNRLQLTDPPIYAKNPHWSFDGSQIVFEDDVKGKGRVYIVASAGGTPQRLIPGSKQPWSDPGWSSDAGRIVYATCDCTNIGRSAAPFIETLDLKTEQTARLPGSEGLWSPRWSPDGRFVVALQFDGPPKLFNVQTQRWTELPIARADFPTWSRNSQYIYFVQTTTGTPRVLRVAVSGGLEEKVVDLTGYPTTGWWGGWLGLDSTDAPLLLRDIGTSDIYALTLDRK